MGFLPIYNVPNFSVSPLSIFLVSSSNTFGKVFHTFRKVLEEEMREVDGWAMENFDTLDSSEKTIAIQGDRWWPQTAKQDGDRISKQFLFNMRKKRNERPKVGGVSIRSRSGAPSPKGCVVNGQTTKASNK